MSGEQKSPFISLLFRLYTFIHPFITVSEVLRTLIEVYKEVFRAPTLTDALLLQHYAQTMLVVDEVCREGHPEHMDKASVGKALGFKLPTFAIAPPKGESAADKAKSLMSRLASSKDTKT